MAIKLDTTVRNSRASVIASAIDAGSAGGYLRIYNGTRPATGGGAIQTQTLLAQLQFSTTCAPAPQNGILTFSAITPEDAALAGGTATWARIVDSDETFVLDMDVGLTNSSADLKLNSVDIIAGGPVSIVSATITEGNG